MRNFKISFTTLVALIILLVTTSVLAHGSQVDSANSITMPASLSNGTGTVTTAIAGDMSYQFVEINADKYAKIKKLEAIYNLINEYIKAMNGQTNTYEATLAQYQKDYNETANAIMSTYGIKFNVEGLNAIKSAWVYELTTYDDSAWVKASGKTITLDLTTFEGTKYYIGWVKIGDTYDAEVYVATGTKKDEPIPDDPGKDDPTPDDPGKDDPTPDDPGKDDPTPDDPGKDDPTPDDPGKDDPTPDDPGKDEPTQDEPKQEEPKQEEPKQEEPKTDNNVQPTTPKQDPTTSQKQIPYTGTASTLLGLVTVAGASAVVSYRKYRKIK